MLMNLTLLYRELRAVCRGKNSAPIKVVAISLRKLSAINLMRKNIDC